MMPHNPPIIEGVVWYIALGFGMVFGATFMILLNLLWRFLAGPLQEYLEELFIDPWRHWNAKRWPKSEPTDPATTVGPYRIIISDLHIDTWDSQRKAAFKEFLSCVHATPEVTQIVLNGDLMDLPLHPVHAGKDEPVILTITPGSTATRNPLLPEADEAQEPWQGALPRGLGGVLKEMALLTVKPRQTPLRVYYFTGNHDIGISGLRYLRSDVPALPAQAVWNPSGLLLGPEIPGSGDLSRRRAVYIEHGHLYDPFLWLYLRYAFLDLLRSGQNRRDRSLVQGLQRGGKHGLAQPQQTNLMQQIVAYSYRHAARRARNRLRLTWPELEITTVVFGHTHLPDELLIPGKTREKGHNWRYINAGSWSGERFDQSYCVMRPDGTATGPHQWTGGKLELG